MPSEKNKKRDERDKSPARAKKRYWVALSEQRNFDDNTNLKIFANKEDAKEYISDKLERTDDKQWKSVKTKKKITYSCSGASWMLWNKHLTS